jgi:hypothetical protein
VKRLTFLLVDLVAVGLGYCVGRELGGSVGGLFGAIAVAAYGVASYWDGITR